MIAVHEGVTWSGVAASPSALLEHELAAWLSPCIPEARALTSCTGYMANLALLTALGDANATIQTRPRC